jgi:parallel beta-helix repeat protein
MAKHRRHVIRVTLVLLVATVSLPALDVVGGGRAAAGTLGCGDTITVDTTLAADLLNCPSNGIVIGADDITLDLNGHTIDGNNALVDPCPENEFCDVGVLNDGHNGVRVTNGSVQEFAEGVFILASRGTRVVDVSSSRNAFFGFIVFESARSVVRNSSGNDNVPPEGDGLGVFGSHDIRVVDNAFKRNGLGIHVEDSTDNLIQGNTISRNEGPGIFLQADRNQIRGNVCHENGICILVGPGNRNTIARNRVERDVDGIAVEKGRHNLIARNLVIRTRKGGISLGIAAPSIGGGSNIVRRNLVKGSGIDAFRVNRRDDHSVLKLNVARRAGDDGFDIRSRTAKLTGNLALRNADLGILAVRGVIDGGGNIARGNGDPRQCVNISCS